uniref:Uncharacterized protein n=1 Tax=Arundo donax TaxID=35708 RepID=A0A0A9GSA2_ARUDO
MLEVYISDPKFFNFYPFILYSIINPITLEKHNISFESIVQLNDFCINTITCLGSNNRSFIISRVT